MTVLLVGLGIMVLGVLVGAVGGWWLLYRTWQAVLVLLAVGGVVLVVGVYRHQRIDRVRYDPVTYDGCYRNGGTVHDDGSCTITVRR